MLIPLIAICFTLFSPLFAQYDSLSPIESPVTVANNRSPFITYAPPIAQKPIILEPPNVDVPNQSESPLTVNQDQTDAEQTDVSSDYDTQSPNSDEYESEEEEKSLIDGAVSPALNLAQPVIQNQTNPSSVLNQTLPTNANPALRLVLEPASQLGSTTTTTPPSPFFTVPPSMWQALFQSPVLEQTTPAPPVTFFPPPPAMFFPPPPPAMLFPPPPPVTFAPSRTSPVTFPPMTFPRSMPTPFPVMLELSTITPTKEMRQLFLGYQNSPFATMYRNRTRQFAELWTKHFMSGMTMTPVRDDRIMSNKNNTFLNQYYRRFNEIYPFSYNFRHNPVPYGIVREKNWTPKVNMSPIREYANRVLNSPYDKAVETPMGKLWIYCRYNCPRG